MISSSGEAVAYTCPDCGRMNEPLEIPVLGTVRKIRRVCACIQEQWLKEDEARRDQERREMIRRLSLMELGTKFGACRFENFIPRMGATVVLEATRDYASNFDDYRSQGKGLLIFGTSGNGKTHLAAAIVNELVPRGITCVFRSVPAILAKLKETWHDETAPSEHTMIRSLVDADLLVLDDAGAENWTKWGESTLYYVVDERYRRKRPVVVTTNCDLEALEEQIGTRSFDRLVETCTIVENRATSYRTEQARKRRTKQ